jgi:hypothetical protein
VCLLDLGLREREGDQFYLLKSYGLDTVMIIVSGSDSLEMGYAAASLGARGMIHKTVLSRMKLVEQINEKFLESILLPGLLRGDRLMVKAVDVAKRRVFKTVEEWSMSSDVEEEYLDACYGDVSEASAEIRLLLHRLYKAALTDNPTDTVSASTDFTARGKPLEGIGLQSLYRRKKNRDF